MRQFLEKHFRLLAAIPVLLLVALQFGSALRDDFRDDRDVDLLCTLRPDKRRGLFEWVALKLDFEAFFGRPVDLVSRAAIERSRNPYRRIPILKNAIPIYVEG